MGEFEIVTPRIAKKKQVAGKLYTITATPTDPANPFAGTYTVDDLAGLAANVAAGDAFRVRIIVGNNVVYDPVVVGFDGNISFLVTVNFDGAIVMVYLSPDGRYSCTVLNPA